MDAGISGLIGVFLGGLITNFGIIYQNWNLEGRENRAVYIDFISVVNRGIRFLEDIARLEKTIEQNMKRTKKAKTKNDLMVIANQSKNVDKDLETVQYELDQFLLSMDTALAKFQFHAPVYLLKYGRLLREGIDECARGEIELDDLSMRYTDLVSASRFALKGNLYGKTADKVISRRNNKLD